MRTSTATKRCNAQELCSTRPIHILMLTLNIAAPPIPPFNDQYRSERQCALPPNASAEPSGRGLCWIIAAATLIPSFENHVLLPNNVEPSAQRSQYCCSTHPTICQSLRKPMTMSAVAERCGTIKPFKILMCPENLAKMIEAKEKEMGKRTENQ